MAEAKFNLTDVLVARLRAALDGAGHQDIVLRLNEDPDDEEMDESFDDSTDDLIEFVLADGTVLERHVQSGPYGIGLNRMVCDDAGMFEGIEHGQVFEVLQMTAFVEHAVERISRDVAPAAPAIR